MGTRLKGSQEIGQSNAVQESMGGPGLGVGRIDKEHLWNSGRNLNVGYLLNNIFISVLNFLGMIIILWLYSTICFRGKMSRYLQLAFQNSSAKTNRGGK